MFRKVTILTAVLLFFLTVPANALMQEGAEHEVEPDSLGSIVYGWGIWSQSTTFQYYDQWEFGVSAQPGPTDATLTYSKMTAWTNSYSGSLKISKGELEAAIGYSVSTHSQDLAEYSPLIPAWHGATIEWRNVYSKDNVRQRRWQDHWIWGKEWLDEYAWVYPLEHQGFDFRVILW